jgi:hypothetical protein
MSKIARASAAKESLQEGECGWDRSLGGGSVFGHSLPFCAWVVEVVSSSAINLDGNIAA